MPLSHLAALCLLISLSFSRTVVSAPQLIAVADPLSGQAVLLDEKGSIRSAIAGVGFVNQVVTDGTGLVWMGDYGAGCLYHFEFGRERVEVRAFSGFLIDLVMTADRGVVVATRWGGGSPGQLTRLSPSGSVIWQVEIAPAVTGVAIDAEGAIHTIHGIGFSQGLLCTRNRNGVFQRSVETGIGPTVVASSLNGTTYVLCGGSDQLWLHRVGAANLVHQLPSGVAGMALSHRDWVALSRPEEDEILMCGASGQYQRHINGAPNGISWCGDGRVVIACSVSGVLSWLWPQSVVGEFNFESPGIICRGDMTGYQWAGTAGGSYDSDGDGFSNSEEIQGGTHPFQASSTPMSINMAPGVPGLCRLSSTGTPGSIFFMGLSHEKTNRGCGYLGLSLAADSIALASLYSTVFQASPLGAFDAIGQACMILDPIALAMVMPVWAGFVALPEFPSVHGLSASPAMRLMLQ